MNQLGKYLGVPLSGKTIKRSDYQYVMSRIASKLVMWKANQLSFASRVTLAKSVLEGIPIYTMMSSMLLKSCRDKIHRLQRNFIWEDSEVALV